MMDIYQKALKNPDPPKKPASTTTTPPSSTSTDYNTRLPPMNHNNNNVDSMNYNYSHDNGSFTGSTTTTTTTNISNENSNNNSSTNSPNSRPSSTNTNTNAHTSEEIKNNVIRKKKNSRRKHQKLDANSSSSTTANINNNTKLIDPSKDNILVQQQQPVGIVQSLAHGTSIVPPHPSTAAAAGSQNAPMMATGPGSYPMAATVLPNNQTLVTAVPQQSQASMSIPPFANSILAPGIQANPSPSITTNNLNSSIANTTSNTNNNTNADMTSSGSTSGNIQNIASTPQVVQSPYGPMIPLLTQSGSVVYAPTHSLVPAQPSQLPPQQLQNNVAFSNTTVPATGTLPPPMSQPSVLSTANTAATTSPNIPPLAAPPPTTGVAGTASTGIMANVSPVLTNKQQPSSTPITSSAASVATIASQTIPVKTATVSPPGIANILPPPINTLGNSSNGANSSGTDVFKPNVSDSSIKELKPINDSNGNTPPSTTTSAIGNYGDGVKLSPNSSMTNLKKLTIREDNNSGSDIKLPSITTLKRESSKSPSETNGNVDEKVPTISKLIT
ncbi:hypothetical protein FOB64_002730 [Candida albicans]|uniref:Uncharacterized protein n=1 Tax=Candida albicans TaxID=5476 RepID=A0A8H6F499_CANAX|nr:hypothetical protein FOB64_002730 [Candida albicans]